MGIVSVYRKYAGLSGKGTLAGERNYRIEYEVITDSGNDGVMVVGNASGIPHKGDVYYTATDHDPGALCQDVSPKQDPNNEMAWVVVATYSSHSGDPADDDPNPMAHPPDIHWGSWAETRSLDKDLDDKPFVATNGQPIDPPFTRRFKHPMLTIVRNETTFPVGLLNDYWDHVNSDVFNGWAPETVKVEDIRASSEYREAQAFFRVTYEFLFRKAGWKHKELSQGTFHLEAAIGPPLPGQSFATSRKTNIMDGVPTTNAVPLDEDGDQLTQARIDADDFVYDEWRLFDKKPFSVFGF